MKTFSTLRKIFSLLRLAPQKKQIKFFLLLALIIFSSVVEVFSVYLIIPTYKSLIDNVPISETLPFLSRVFKISFNYSMQEQLLVLFVFAIVFTSANLLKALVMYQNEIQSADISVFLFSSAYERVLLKPYEQLSAENISRFSSNFNTTNTYFWYVFKNSILLIGYISTTLILALTLLNLNTEITIFGFFFLFIPYLILSKFTTPIFRRMSKQQSTFHEEINRYIQEGFKSLKTIKHFRVNKYYTDIFYKKEFGLRRRYALVEFLSAFPKLILESLGIILITILFGITFFIKSIEIPVVFIITLAFSAQKILPSLQQIYRVWTYISAHSSAVDDLYSYFSYEKVNPRKNITFDKNEIIFKNIFYKYPKNENFTLANFNLKISYPNSISISGSSGCGKTTLIDLMTGLLMPTKGSIIFPKEFKESKNIGYVPQEVPLINGSILDNIYLGDNKLKKDDIYLQKSIEIVELKEFIKQLPAGLNTILGEQSINLSGGQKQRLGILRALVRKPKILILDESTNAIDPDCEKAIIEKLIIEFKESLIIMISHNQNINNKFKVNIHLNKKGELIKPK